MPQIDFKTSSIRIEKMIEELLDEGCLIVPDMRYSAREYLKLSTIAEFTEIRHKTNVFFIIHNDWETQLLMHSISKSEHVLLSKGSEPYIALATFRVKEGDQLIEKGSLSYQSMYWDFEIEMDLPSPPHLIKIYKKAVKCLKTNAQKEKRGFKTYWRSE